MNTRRGFLLAGVSAVASSAALAQVPSRYANRVKLSVEGQTYLQYVLYNPQLNPDFSGVPSGAEFWVRQQFPFDGKDILETFVSISFQGQKIPLSRFLTHIRDIELTGTPADGAISLHGKVIDNPVLSPFGDLTGKPATFSSAVQQIGSQTVFRFFAGVAAGSHVTVVPEAVGKLEIRTPWHAL